MSLFYRFLGAVVLLLAISQAAHAVRPDEILNNPALEARARAIGQDLRCLVCQNQSIDDSDADLAHDLRVLVRQRLKTGATDEQVKQYIVARYGDYVLLKPPFEPQTYILWFGPAALLAAALLGAVLFLPKPEIFLMLWFILIALIAATAGFLLYPLMQKSDAAPNEKRARFIAVIIIVILLPIGAMTLYVWLGSPELAGRPYISPS